MTLVVANSLANSTKDVLFTRAVLLVRSLDLMPNNGADFSGATGATESTEIGSVGVA